MAIEIFSHNATTGLTTVGLTLLNRDRTVAVARTEMSTEGEVLPGLYEISVDVPADFDGYLRWDDGAANDFNTFDVKYPAARIVNVEVTVNPVLSLSQQQTLAYLASLIELEEGNPRFTAPALAEVPRTGYALSTAGQNALVAAIEVELANDATGGELMQAIADKLAAAFDIEDVSLIAIRDVVLNRVLAGNHDTAGTVGRLLQTLPASGTVNTVTPNTVVPATPAQVAALVAEAASAVQSAVGTPQQAGAAVTLPDPAPAGYGGDAGADVLALGVGDAAGPLFNEGTAGYALSRLLLPDAPDEAVVVIPVQDDPLQVTGALVTYDARGEIHPEVELEFRLLSAPAGSAGRSFASRFTATSDVEGRLSAAFLRGATYEGRRAEGIWQKFAVDDDEDPVFFLLPVILGRGQESV